MLEKYRQHIWLHVIVFIYGFTGVLGKLIEADTYLLVWYRVGVALICMAVYFFIIKHSLKVERKILYKILGGGILIALHWLTFFEAIKQSNVSVALVCLSSSALFTSIIEPLYFKRKIKPYELIFGMVIIVGLYFIFSFEFKYLTGMLLSILSAALSSWVTVINGTLIKETNSRTISFYELLGAFVLVTFILLGYKGFDLDGYKIITGDIKWLLILGIICTAFTFIISVEIMKKITPYSVIMTINLEPIYSIILALLIWPESETMSYGFYMGTIIVLLTIFLNGYLKGKENKTISLKN